MGAGTISMSELMNIKTKADLWWQERRGFLKGLFKNPLFLALGVRISQPDAQTVILRLPWGKTQKFLASEIPMSILLGSAEMALQLHLRQFQIFSPVNIQFLGADLEVPRPLDQAAEIRLRSTWPEWEELRLELAKNESVVREYIIPLWAHDSRTLGTVVIRVCMQAVRFLPPTRDRGKT